MMLGDDTKVSTLLAATVETEQALMPAGPDMSIRLSALLHIKATEARRVPTSKAARSPSPAIL